MNLNLNKENDVLRCYICTQKVKKARMCPHCSKLACYQCLRTWVTENQNECPNCRRIVHLHNFADCERFIDNLKNEFKKIDKIQKKQKCKYHQLQIIYYCNSCSEAICSDCGMFTEKHKGHDIIHLYKIYEQKKTKILNQMRLFDMKVEQYKDNSNLIKQQIHKLLMESEQKKRFLTAYFTKILQKLEEERKQKQNELISKIQQNQKQIKVLTHIKEQLLQMLESYSQNQIIHKTNDILDNINKNCNTPIDQPQSYKPLFTLNQIIPQYNTFTYLLKEFSKLDDGIKYSDSYSVNGIQWRLKIYPKGNGIAKQKCLSIFLEMSNGYKNDTKYEYKIELVNQQDQTESIVREYSSKFDIGECWGYNQFMDLEILNQGFLLNDSLLFKFYIRNPNYKCLSNDQSKFIQKLQAKVKELQKLVIQNNFSKAIESKIILKQNHFENSDIKNEMNESKLANLKNETNHKKLIIKNQLLLNDQIEYEFLKQRKHSPNNCF